MAKQTYIPTGRPPGRPRVPEVKKQGIQDVVTRFANLTSDRRHMVLSAYCPDCFPSGFPEGERAMACQHGVWVNNL